jgi:hypothetical protein
LLIRCTMSRILAGARSGEHEEAEALYAALEVLGS